MLKKIIKNLLKKVSKVDYKLFTIAVLGTLLATGFVFAYQGGTTTVIEEAHDFIIEGGCKIAEEIGLGASADFCAGDEPVTNMCVVDIYDLTVAAGGFTSTGAVTMSGENSLTGTTSIPMLDATIQQPLDWSNGTTTEGEATVVVLLDYTHEGADIICDNRVWSDLSTSRGIWGADMAIGTTTSLNDSSLVATSTATLIASTHINTSTINVLSKADDEGSWTEDPWILKNGDHLVVTDTFDIVNATSSASFTTAGGFTGVGKLHLDCRNRF